MCSGSQLFQNTVAQVLAGIPGCRNAADYILVAAGQTYGKKHNATFQRLQASGLTLNEDICSLMAN